MSSRSSSSRSLRDARRRDTLVGSRRPVMSEQQLVAYLTARDAVRRANLISQFLPYRARQDLFKPGPGL